MVAGKFLAREWVTWGERVPLHERQELNCAADGPVAALEVLKDWVLHKQCHHASPPGMQTDRPSCLRHVGLKYSEEEGEPPVNKSDGPSLDRSASFSAQAGWLSLCYVLLGAPDSSLPVSGGWGCG